MREHAFKTVVSEAFERHDREWRLSRLVKELEHSREVLNGEEKHIERAGQTADPLTGRRGGSVRGGYRPAHRVVVIPETRALSPMPYADRLSRPNVP